MSAIKRFIEDEVTRISEDTGRDWCEVMDEYMEKINQSEDPIKIGYIPVEYNRYKELVEKAEKYDRLSGWNLPRHDTSYENSLYEDFMNGKSDYIVLDFHDDENSDALEEIKDVMYDIFGNGMYAVRMSDVRELPTVYRSEGKWVTDEEYINCSNCKKERWSRIPYEELVKGFKYCPNCGADMRERRETMAKDLKIYIVVHEYSVDGGFGDAVYEESIIGCFINKEDAEDFVDRYSKERVYDTPYNDLTCGRLSVREQKLFTHEDYISKEEWFWLPERNGMLPDELVSKSQAKKSFLCYLKEDADLEIKSKVKAVVGDIEIWHQFNLWSSELTDSDKNNVTINNTFDVDDFIDRFIRDYNLSYELLEEFLENDLETYKKELNDKAKKRSDDILSILENNHANV